MKAVFNLAAAIIAASVLGACSGGVAPLPTVPPVGVTSSLHEKPHMKSMYTAVCHDDITSNATACYYNPPGPEPGAPAPGGYGCIQYCSGQPVVGMPRPGGMGGGGCVYNINDCVATVDPAAGLDCDGSQGKLGTSNMASTSGQTESGNDSTVVDIFGLKPNPVTNTAYSWVYITADGNIFIQRNPAVGVSSVVNWFGQVLGGVPFGGPALTATIQDIVNKASEPRQITSAEWGDIQNSIGYKNTQMNDRGPVVHECFTGPLKVG